jgi:hypothetical protein
MPFILESRRRKTPTLEKQYPDAQIIDLTSRGPEPWGRFSPFYPHGGIPVPNSPGVAAESVDFIWQSLKVFEREDIDQSKFHIKSMRGIKRSSRSRGPVLGHRHGVASDEMLGYREARFRIYLPCYRWMLCTPLPQCRAFALTTLFSRRKLPFLVTISRRHEPRQVISLTHKLPFVWEDPCATPRLFSRFESI